MRVTAWIALRSFRTYFFRPIGWFLTAGFMAITGWYFAEKMEVAGDAQLIRSVFFLMEHLSILIIPLLAMGTLAGERQDGTLETLLTAPVRIGEVVVGKFVGVFLFYLFLILTSIPLVLILQTYGTVDFGPVVSGYAGTSLAGAGFLALGMLCSATCDRPLMAALMTFLVIFVLRLTPTFTMAMDPGPVRDLLLYLHYRPHLVPFRQGVLDTRHLVYFLSAILLFLSGAIYVMTLRARAS